MIKKHLVFWIVIVMVSGILAFGGCAGDKTLPEQTTAQNLQMEFAYIPAGEFVMGSPSYDTGRFADEVLHKVEITESFYIQTTEVTQHQWETVMGNNPSEFKHCGLDCPVENVSWNDAQKFIKRLNQRQNTGKFRLPTEAEWEYACRLGAEKGKLFDVPLLSNIAEATDRNVKMVASFFSPI